MNQHSKYQKYLFYLLSLFVPAAIFAGYFLMHHNNVMTVDLGQQYVDFLAFFRAKLFSNPLELIYTFQNGLGNSFIGTMTYYLMSPFNLILFLFPQKMLPQAILAVITAKVAFSGLTSFYYWNNKYHNQFAALAASCAYAISGYVVANYLNLMWLDSVVFLPLLIRAIDQLMAGKKNHLILITWALWVTNFYTGYMALLFGFLYFLTQQFAQTWSWPQFRAYLLKSFYGSMLAAFVLIPSVIELLQGKASSNTKWTFGWQFMPFKAFLKLIDGAYNYHEMEAGWPNIYLTVPLFLMALAYFFNQAQAARQRLANGLLLLFMFCSLWFTPLVLIWHMGQFPVWYPARFSFVVVFWLLELAVNFLATSRNFKLWQFYIIAACAFILVSYWAASAKSVAFINQNAMLLASICAVLALFFLLFFKERKYGLALLYVLVATEAGFNLVWSFDHISFQQNSAYTNFTENMQKATNYVNQRDKTFFRFDKTFFRSDDDSFSDNYNGIANFNSITNQQTLNLMKQLGYYHNSNSYTNHGGTPITDAILGVKYYAIPNSNRSGVKTSQLMNYDNRNYRIDVNSNKIINTQKQLVLYQAASLPLTFISNTSNQVAFKENSPIVNQTNLLGNILGKKLTLFHSLAWPTKVQTQNASKWPGSWLQYDRKNSKNEASVSFTFTPQDNDSYYLELPSGMNNNSVGVYLNGVKLDNTTRDDQYQLINLARMAKGQKLTLKLTFNSNSLNLNQAVLWHFNQQDLQKMLQRFNQKQPTTKQTGALSLKTSTFTTSKATKLKSTIPYSSFWQVYDNGKRLTTHLFAKAFISVNLSAGRHRITYVYVPWHLIGGILISLLTGLWLLLARKLFSGNKEKKPRPAGNS
ncbi:YfhO family protein [Lactobacillus corticis]|nr:YfhO family protein [Lactobacillus corticis]